MLRALNRAARTGSRACSTIKASADPATCLGPRPDLVDAPITFDPLQYAFDQGSATGQPVCGVVDDFLTEADRPIDSPRGGAGLRVHGRNDPARGSQGPQERLLRDHASRRRRAVAAGKFVAWGGCVSPSLLLLLLLLLLISRQRLVLPPRLAGRARAAGRHRGRRGAG